MTIRVMRFFIYSNILLPSGFAISSASLKLLLSSCPRAGIRKAAESMSRRTKPIGRGTVPHACHIFCITIYIICDFYKTPRRGEV